jgi:hypothetical protein
VATPPELSSLIATLEELSARFTRLGEDAQRSADEETAVEMFAAERALTGTLRRLRRFDEGRRS